MTHREKFLKIMRGEAIGWTPNYELGCWGQTTQRWLDEGMPVDLETMNMWAGVPTLDIDRELHAKIPSMLEGGGFIPHLDHAFPPDISYDDFCYYLDLKRRLIGHCG